MVWKEKEKSEPRRGGWPDRDDRDVKGDVVMVYFSCQAILSSVKVVGELVVRAPGQLQVTAI